MAHKTQPRAFMHGQDRLVHCPLDSTHEVKESRLDIHLLKCGKYHRRSWARCRYNGNHLVPKDALHEHHASCPDRQSQVSGAKSAAASAAEADALYPIRQVQGMPEPQESWDAEVEDLDSWRQPQREPVFRPVPIGRRSADDNCAFYGALNTAPPPTGPVRTLQPSGGSQRASTSFTLQAAADKLVALRHAPQPCAWPQNTLACTQDPHPHPAGRERQRAWRPV